MAERILATPRVVLAVDQATQSGWCIHVARRYVSSGVLAMRDWAARREVFRSAHALSGDGPLLFAYEDHSATPLRSYKSTAQLLALGAALGLWLDTIQRSGHIDVMHLGVSSRSWRKRVLGADERVGRDDLKRQSVRWAQSYTGKRQLSDDEADAVALGAFASCEPLVHLPTRNPQTKGKRCASR